MSGKYGPPKYDVSMPGYKGRIRKQAESQRPSPMYSSNWHAFQKDTLRGDRVVDNALRKLAMKSAFRLKREIPIGPDSRDGHLRNKVKVDKVLRGGRHNDRTVYHVHGGGSGSKRDVSHWNEALYRATFSDSEKGAYSKREAGEYGSISSWLKNVDRSMNR